MNNLVYLQAKDGDKIIFNILTHDFENEIDFGLKIWEIIKAFDTRDIYVLSTRLVRFLISQDMHFIFGEITNKVGGTFQYTLTMQDDKPFLWAEDAEERGYNFETMYKTITQERE